MPGYYRMPTIYEDSVVFVCEDDLWIVSADGGIPRRLTSNLGAMSFPRFSPDGARLALTGREEGPTEVYVMSSLGGAVTRLTYQGAGSTVVAWTPDGDGILYASNASQPFPHIMWLWNVSPDGGQPTRLPYGVASHIAFGPDGGLVLARNAGRDPARWKRYRGGTVGQLWIDPDGSGEFNRLIPADGNFTAPIWIGDRIFFISDHEGIGNLYSCLPDGGDLRRHTEHEQYYVRNASSDGRRIVYHAGADLYVYDPASGEDRMIDVDYRSPLVQRQRKFVDSGRYLQDYALSPDGKALSVTVRGKPFTMSNWEGAVLQHGELHGTRYRLANWLNDGKRLVAISDAGGEEAIEIHHRDGEGPPIRLDGLDIGRPLSLAVSPKKDQVVLTNHRFELLHVDLELRKLRVLDRSHYDRIAGVSWSPDGRWVAYGFSATHRTTNIRICDVETGETWPVTPREFRDVAPAWDPDGKYLYFLSFREFNPVYDQLHFDLGFPRAMRPLLITLRQDLPNPFIPQPVKDEEPEKKDDDSQNADGNKSADADGAESEPQDTANKENGKDAKNAKKKDEKAIEIDFEGIDRRIIAFPYPEGRYGQIDGIPGKALFTSFPVKPALPSPGTNGDSGPQGILHVYDFKEQKKDTLVTGIDAFSLSRDRKQLVIRVGNRLRVLKAGEKPDENASKEGPSRRSGWIDLHRVRCAVVPFEEWRQMYREAWRLQREYFWTEDMSAVDWELVYQRYLPLLERIATRGEFSDLMWEMQGELGTSHAYEMGGDYRPSPNYGLGALAAEFDYDADAEAYRIRHIVRGDSWDEPRDSPLNRPGIGVREGDLLLAIGGRRLGPTQPPSSLLVNLAGQEIALTVQDRESGERRSVTVKALSSEVPARYREWVARNRETVHERTNQQVGYIHIPDMGGRGYAEFHRGFLAEIDYPGLLVDVRHNRGGHVSQLLIEKLARRRVGYDIMRWGAPDPYPSDSVMGPMVALADENAGSDGDIFTHVFKLLKLGSVVGVRTWGGVIGISPQSTFVDGGLTTQPGYAFWFEDVGWAVENYGTDPDIEVPYRPQDFVAGVDPQLDRAIDEILRQMEEHPPRLPDFGDRPRLPLPKLPR